MIFHLIISIKYTSVSILSFECIQRQSLHQLYTLIGEYVLVTFTQAHLRLLSSFTLASYHIVTSFINFNTFVFHNYSPLDVNFYFIMTMHLAIQCVSQTYLTLLGLHHFITYILCQIMGCRTYVSRRYAKILISIIRGNIH